MDEAQAAEEAEEKECNGAEERAKAMQQAERVRREDAELRRQDDRELLRSFRIANVAYEDQRSALGQQDADEDRSEDHDDPTMLLVKNPEPTDD